MSQPHPEHHTSAAPYTDPALYEPRTRLHIVRPAPAPEKPATPKTDPRIARQLTWDEIKYFIDHDPGKFFEDDFYREVQFDRTIDAEPEIE